MKAGKSPGKGYRKGITLIEFFRKFPSDQAAEDWFIEQRWPGGDICCPRCGSLNVQTGCKHKTMPFRCRERACGRRRFSTKTGTVMEHSKLGYQVWLLANFLLLTSLKSVSSLKLHRDLGVTQKTAWFLAHRIRKAMAQNEGIAAEFEGPVEADETFVGGKRKNMSNAKRKTLTGSGTVGKTVVAGIKDRETNEVVAKVVPSTAGKILKSFVTRNTLPKTIVYTDESLSYKGIARIHAFVKHSVRQWVSGAAHTNGIESFWSMLKRSYMGTFHKLSPKHLNRYVQELVARHNMRPMDTADQMAVLAFGMEGQRLTYQELIASNGLPSGARA